MYNYINIYNCVAQSSRQMSLYAAAAEIINSAPVKSKFLLVCFPVPRRERVRSRKSDELIKK